MRERIASASPEHPCQRPGSERRGTVASSSPANPSRAAPIHRPLFNKNRPYQSAGLASQSGQHGGHSRAVKKTAMPSQSVLPLWSRLTGNANEIA
jgi:hypothetical protein